MKLLKEHADMVHGCLTPFNIVITDSSGYKIIGVGSLYQYSSKYKKIVVSRKIE